MTAAKEVIPKGARTQVLDVDLAGSSDVRYLGEPTLGDVKMRGDSTLERGS